MSSNVRSETLLATILAVCAADYSEIRHPSTRSLPASAPELPADAYPLRPPTYPPGMLDVGHAFRQLARHAKPLRWHDPIRVPVLPEVTHDPRE